MQIIVTNETDYVECTRMALKLTKDHDFSRVKQSMFATIVSELARNILDHAREGVVLMHILEVKGRLGIEVIARDTGPGIEDIRLAMTDSYTTKNTLGLGLPGAKRLSDEFNIESTVGIGTTVNAKKWRD